MEIAWKHLGLSAPPWVQVHRKVSKLRWPMQYKSHQQITKTFLKNQKTLIHVTKDMSHSTYFFWLLKVFHDLTFHFNFLEMILVFFEMFFHFFVDFLKIKSCFFILFFSFLLESFLCVCIDLLIWASIQGHRTQHRSQKSNWRYLFLFPAIWRR